MKLSHLFDVSPFLALSFCVCLGTAVWCTILLRRGCHHRADRFLVGFIGLLSLYQSAQILHRGGVLVSPNLRQVDEAVALMVNSLYLLAALILRVSNHDRFETIFRLRLAEAQPVVHVHAASLDRRAPDPRFLESIRLAMEVLSASSLKLYLYICFHAEGQTDLLETGEHELAQVLSNDRKTLLAGLKELKERGLCDVEHVERVKGSVRIARASAAGRLNVTMVNRNWSKS